MTNKTNPSMQGLQSLRWRCLNACWEAGEERRWASLTVPMRPVVIKQQLDTLNCLPPPPPTSDTQNRPTGSSLMLG